MAGFDESEVGVDTQQWVSIPGRVHSRLNVLAREMKMVPSEVIEVAISALEMSMGDHDLPTK